MRRAPSYDEFELCQVEPQAISGSHLLQRPGPDPANQVRHTRTRYVERYRPYNHRRRRGRRMRNRDYDSEDYGEEEEHYGEEEDYYGEEEGYYCEESEEESYYREEPKTE